MPPKMLLIKKKNLALMILSISGITKQKMEQHLAQENTEENIN